MPAKLAGKRGACSKCGTAVVIPPASVAIPRGNASGSAGTPVTEMVAAADEGPIGDEGTITLSSAPPWSPLSPNHPNQVDAVERRPGPPLPAGQQGTAGEEHPGGVFSGSAPAGPAATTPRASGQANPVPWPEAPSAVQGGGENPTAALVARLWAERDHGGIVELHLVGGSVILPEWYEPRWSIGRHGLFASQAADGSVTLTAVAWDSIQKVVVRQVEGLPDGMFE